MASDTNEQSANGNSGKSAFEQMAEAIKEQAAATTMILQHMQANENGNSNFGGGNGNPPNGVLTDNPNFRGLSEFRKAGPPSFDGKYDPVAADNWLRELEKIFNVMMCTDTQKVTFAAFMLKSEAEHWWRGARDLLEAQHTQITWEVFQNTFLEKISLPALEMRRKLSSCN